MRKHPCHDCGRRDGVSEVAVDKDKGTVQVKRVVCAQDMGVIINPEGAKIQLEGCVTMGLGYALTEEVHFKGGQVLDTNYDTTNCRASPGCRKSNPC